MSEERYSSLKNTYGVEHFQKVWNSKILVVGAGGIGCEILKNLVLGGFKTIEVIDLDTIDVSNLNRQFLFRPEHVGKPKSLIAAEAATRFNPDVKITPHYGNIKDAKFGISYIATFNIVLNALDNVDARRHVNRLCLAANVPLIDSGTTGYLGQVMPIFKGVTSCYECTPKPTQKVYPICTIRSTPDKPVHCIVWAKECFKLLFGNTSESMLFEDSSLGEVSSYMDVLELYRNSKSDIQMNSIINIGKDMLIALYHTEVEKKIDMDVYKNAKTKPVSTSINIFESAANIALNIINNVNKCNTRPSKCNNWDQNLWSDSDCAVEFMLSLTEAINMKGDDNSSLLGKLVFDKDDDLAMRFVSAASNIRSRIFSIAPLNFHDCKGIAGNIIPAIATTNAIVAGIQVLQAVKVLKGHAEINKDLIKSICPYTYCLRLPTRRGYYLQPSSPEEPNPLCYICSNSQLTLQIDVTKSKLSDFITKVVKGKLGINEPTIIVGSNVLYEEGDDADEELQDNLTLVLNACPGGGIIDGSVVNISDYTQDLEVSVIIKQISNEDLLKIEDGDAVVDLFIIDNNSEYEKKQLEKQKASSIESSSLNGPSLREEDDDVMILEEQIIYKRGRDEDNDLPISKRSTKSDTIELN